MPRPSQLLSQLAITPEERTQAFGQIRSAAEFSVDYLTFILLSAVVATLGLFTDSVAVIIGAMVLAPLMNPVLGISMGVVRGDLTMVGLGLRTLGWGLLLGLLVAMTISWSLPEAETTTQILLRIRPTLYDLVVGMAAGAGGALGQTRKSVAGVLPGAAIAVSLMPPLCVTGIGLQQGLWPVFSGSLLLWVANLAAVNLSAILVFWALGFGDKSSDETVHEFRRHLAISVAIVVLLTLPLLHILRDTVKESRYRKLIQKIVSESLRSQDYEADIDALEWGPDLKRDGWLRVVATVRIPQLPEQEEIFRLRAELESSLGQPVALTMRINPVVEYREIVGESTILERPKPRRPLKKGVTDSRVEPDAAETSSQLQLPQMHSGTGSTQP